MATGERARGNDYQRCPACDIVPRIHYTDRCDKCLRVWCTLCFPFGGTIEALIAHHRWKVAGALVLRTIGTGEEALVLRTGSLFCLSCYEALNMLLE